MPIFKDGGGGITRISLDFWKRNKNRIGAIRHIEVSQDPLRQDEKQYLEEGKFAGITYNVDYTFIVHGDKGEIWLSGCNSGYSGEGPHGTAKILEEFGITVDHARLIITYKHIDFYPENKEIRIDNIAGLWETVQDKYFSFNKESS